MHSLRSSNQRAGGPQKDPKKPRINWRKVIKRTAVTCGVLALVFVGYFGYRVLDNTGKIFKGNPLDAIFAQQAPLQQDKYGRTNILVVGTSESDPNHPGAQLTDSMMIISADQTKHNAFIVSVPRDLWVKIPNCNMFSAQKINAIYECASDMGKNEDAGQQALREQVGSVFGMDIQYSVHLNLSVVQSAVDAVGGVDITINSPDPRGVLDRNFDWRCNYQCYLVKYPNGPVHLNGTQAMWLAQARGDAPQLGTYGFSRGNFDREQYQRQILLALKDKATSIGFLANPSSVLNLMDSLGNNVHTNINSNEIKTFIALAKNINGGDVNSVSLIDQTPAIVTTGTGPDGSSIVETTAGLYDYSPLQSFIKAYETGAGPLLQENAQVAVFNATNTGGQAKATADKLNQNGIAGTTTADAPSTDAIVVQIFDQSGGKKPATLNKLQSVLGVKASTGALPDGITSDADFVVIVGDPTLSGSNTQ